jgi:gluconokinase
MILALDLGSSSARATLYDEAGAPVAGGRRQIDYAARVTAAGAVEHDARALVEVAAACIDAVLPAAGEVEGVGVSTFWHGLLGFDGAARPVTPVYMYSDTRSADAARDLQCRLDEVTVRARTGCPLHSSYWPAKLRWLAAASPDLRVERWGSVGELLAAEWLGEGVSSLSMASGTGLLDQATARWDEAMLEAAGVDERRLFPLVDLDHGLALRRAWASRWPALARARWLPAVGDGAAGNIGSGCTGPGRIAINVGTSSAMRLVTERPPDAAPWGLWRYRLDGRRAVVGGSLSEGGNVYAWCVDTFRLGDAAGAERALAAAAAEEHGLAVLPFLAGERSPGFSPHARGAFAGLSLATTALDLLRAGLESVALRLALIHDLLAPVAGPGYEVVASGGALLRSRAWTQMIADALGRLVLLAAEREASSRGVALLALAALGRVPDLAALSRTEVSRVEPDPRRHERFLELGARQARLYGAVIGSEGEPPLHSPRRPG